MSDKQTRIGISAARNGITGLVRDVEEGRRPYVVITRGELPVAALVPCTAEGTPMAAWIQRDDFGALSDEDRRRRMGREAAGGRGR